MKKYDIFISYSRKDFDEVNAIVEMLKSRIPTLNCWFDITGIESGDEFEEKILTAIDNSTYVLLHCLTIPTIQNMQNKKQLTHRTSIQESSHYSLKILNSKDGSSSSSDELTASILLIACK